MSCARATLIMALFVGSCEFRLAEGAAPRTGFAHVRTLNEISEYRLDANGLTVLLLPDRSTPAVTTMITYRVGSRNESYGTTGATHLLEHLMFKGTKRHNKEAKNGFDQLLERTGAITNATTWLDRTNYYETTGSGDLALSLELEADRMRNLRLREEDRRPEMTVVRNEYERGENLPAEALEKEIWATAFLAHPYHHSTIGWRSDFEKAPIEKLREFYDTYYWPNNATLTLIGDFETGVALDLIARYFGSIPRSTHVIPDVYTEEPPQTGPRRVIVQRPGELGIVTLAHKIPPALHPDFPALRVLGVVMSDGRNSRFYQSLTDKNLTLDVNAAPSFNRDSTLFTTTAMLVPGSPHTEVESALLAEWSRVSRHGVTTDEVSAAIAKLTASTAFSRDGSFAMASALNECIAVGDWTIYYRLDEAIRQVMPADVQRVAQRYFVADQSVTGWFIPRDDAAQGESTEPHQSSLGKVDSDARSPSQQTSTVSPQRLHAEAKSKAMLASAKTPPALKSLAAPVRTGDKATIASRIVRRRAAGIDLFVCPTGVKDVITISGAFPALDTGRPVIGELVAAMLERGTARHDARQIATMLDQVGATIHFSYETGSVRFSSRCLKQDSPLVISLLAELLREPSFPADEFEKLRKQKLAETQRMREDTDAQAGIAFRRAIYPPEHPLYRLTSDETISALGTATLDEARAFHTDWFGPAHCAFVVVGDADAVKIESQVSKAFLGWKGGKSLPPIADAPALHEGKSIVIQVPGKESVSVILGCPSGLHYKDPECLPLSLATSVLGHGFTSRLIGSVRDTEGLTYGISATLSGRGEFEQTWLIHATFAPALLRQGLVSTRRELDAWHRAGITADELDYRKSAMAGAHNVMLATSGGLAQTILETVQRGLELDWIDEYPRRVAALTLDQVNGAIRGHVDPNQLVVIEAGTIADGPDSKEKRAN